MVRLVSWNIGRRQMVGGLDGLDADLALLQEAGRHPLGASAAEVVPDPNGPWGTAGAGGRRTYRTAICRLTDRILLRPRPTVTVDASGSPADWVVSRDGTITSADVLVGGAVSFTAVSVYAPWEKAPTYLYADASAHRLLSDLSHLLASRTDRLVVAGDWNILHGYGDLGDRYWKARYDTVFERAEALGLQFAGPAHPNGRRADPWPDELPADSACVPTFFHSRQTPVTATRQLDFVFVSKALAAAVRVRALNDVDNWGASDHCRIVIDVNERQGT